MLSLRSFTLFSCIFLLIEASSYADMNTEMNKFFNKLGASANVNSSEIYEGQKAGYFTGGSTTIRNESISTRPVQLELPKFDAGCGGIDIYAGGFSFINKDQLVDTLKSIGSSSIGYAFMLGLETVSPQVANVIKQMQSWANAINSTNINSCEVATIINGSIWPQSQAISQNVCKNLGGNYGIFSDHAEARHKCSNQGDYEKQLETAKNDQNYKGVLFDDYNIAWEAIQKQTLLVGNKDMAEMLMTLMGTLIKKTEGKALFENYPSLIENEGSLSSLINGGDIKVYTCANKDKKCLTIKEIQKTISPKDSWSGKLETILDAIQDKILKDEELDENEKNVLAKSRLPLYKIVNVLTAYKERRCPIDLLKVAELVSTDLLLYYLRECIVIVREGVEQLRRIQMSSQEIDEYLKTLDRIERTIRYYESHNQNNFQKEFMLSEEIRILEEKIAEEVRI
jgi:conjugative transfer pilus assembly protein TraH